MRTDHIIIATAVACLASACAGAPHRLDPVTVGSARATNVSSFTPERQITVKWVASGYGAGMGLVGAIVSASVNDSRKKTAEERGTPLRIATQDIDFQGRYAAALADAVRDVGYLRFQRVLRYDAKLPPVSATDVQRDNLLRVGTDYYLSPDSIVLVVSSGLGFFAAGKPDSAAAVMSTFYRSEEVGKAEDERAVALWAANGGRAYRDALADGAAENLKMTRMAVEHMGGTDYAGPQVRLQAMLEHARGDFGVKQSATAIEGTIVEETARRIILRTEDAFYSIPKSAIEKRETIGTSLGVAWRGTPPTAPLVFAPPAPPPPIARPAVQPPVPPVPAPATGAVPAGLVVPSATAPRAPEGDD